MKLFRPHKGPVLFTSPSVSMLNYDWSLKPLWQKIIYQIFVICGAAVFLTFCPLFFAPHDESHEAVWKFAKRLANYLPIVSLAVAVIHVYLNKVLSCPDRRTPPHCIHEEMIVVYTGYNRSGGFSFFADMVQSVDMEERHFGSRFWLFTVKFEPELGILPRAPERFGVVANTDLKQLMDWFQRHSIAVECRAKN